MLGKLIIVNQRHGEISAFLRLEAIEIPYRDEKPDFSWNMERRAIADAQFSKNQIVISAEFVAAVLPYLRSRCGCRFKTIAP